MAASDDARERTRAVEKLAEGLQSIGRAIVFATATAGAIVTWSLHVGAHDRLWGATPSEWLTVGAVFAFIAAVWP